MNYISQKPNNFKGSPKRISKSPLIHCNNSNNYNYGEKVREKNNYVLYVSGSGSKIPYYEERPKHIKIIKDNYDYYNQNINKIERNINIYQEDNENILPSSDNYKYKETRNVKRENPNLKIVTIHKRLGSPRKKEEIRSPKKSKILKIRKDENMIYQNQYKYIPNKTIDVNNNKKIRVLRENKSSDYFQPLNRRKIIQRSQENGELIQEIIKSDNDDYNYDYNNKYINEDHIETSKNGDYFIKVTTNRKEYDPNDYEYYNQNEMNNNRNIKIIKNNKYLYNNQNNNAIYQRKYIKNKNYENEPYYIGNYGEEENYETPNKYNENNNYRIQEMEDCKREDRGYQRKEYMNNNDYERNRYRYNTNNQENEYEYIEDIKDIKNIECPLHGKISIVIHKNPFIKN